MGLLTSAENKDSDLSTAIQELTDEEIAESKRTGRLPDKLAARFNLGRVRFTKPTTVEVISQEGNVDGRGAASTKGTDDSSTFILPHIENDDEDDNEDSDEDDSGAV